MDTPTSILQADYRTLPISPSFKRFFAAHGIPTLEKLMEIKPKDMHDMKWFTERTLKEYVDLLSDHGLLHLIE